MPSFSGFQGVPQVWTSTHQVTTVDASSDGSVLVDIDLSGTPGVVILGGGYVVAVSQNGNPVDSSSMGPFTAVSNGPLTPAFPGFLGSPTTGWRVELSCSNPDGWFGGDASYEATVVVTVQYAQWYGMTYAP